MHKSPDSSPGKGEALSKNLETKSADDKKQKDAGKSTVQKNVPSTALDSNDDLNNALAVSQMTEFVSESFYAVQHKSYCCRQNVGLLMCTLIRKSVISSQVFLDGLAKLVTSVHNMLPTTRQVWVNLAESVVPLISSGMVRLSDLHRLAGPPANAPRLLTEVLELLAKEEGRAWIDSRWDVSETKWDDFLHKPLDDSHKLAAVSNLK